MKGHIRARGNSGDAWELKLDIGRDAGGKRRIQYHSFRGTRRQAQRKLAELIAALDNGSYVEPHKITVGAFVRSRIDQWEASSSISARTAEGYRRLAEKQIMPHLGAAPLQRLTRLDIEAWHTSLRNGGLGSRSIGHAHRVLGRALVDAERDNLVTRNVCRLQRAPKVSTSEIVIVRDLPGFLAKLDGDRLSVLAIVALSTGMRLSEILALTEGHVDLERGLIEVRQALEVTTAHGLRLKAPKSQAGRRDIRLPTIAIEALQQHRKELLETRLKLGLGKLPADGLLFPNLEGKPLRPSTVSSDWGQLAARIGHPEITFHALRHSHASQLISAGIDIVTISKRLGHAKPNITLAVYAHMFATDDSKAAATINAALNG